MEQIKKQKKNKLLEIYMNQIENVVKSAFFVRVNNIELVKDIIKLCKKLIDISAQTEFTTHILN